MKNNRRGFTLIELLVCVGIVAVLGVVIGLSSNTMFSNAKNSEYKDTMLEVFNAALIYSELSDSSCAKNFTTCNVTLSVLVSKGLVDKKIYNKNNPVYKNDTAFASTNTFTITKTNGIKDVTYYCNSTKYIKLSTIDDKTNWGKC